MPLKITDHSAVMFRYQPINESYGKGRYRMGHETIDNKNFRLECEGILLKFVAEHSKADPEATEDSPEHPDVIIEAWKQVKREIAGLSRRTEQWLRGQLRSRKHTLRLQAQRDNRAEMAREALVQELEEMEEDDRRQYCHHAFVRDYIEEETPSTSFYQRVRWMKGKGHAIPKLKDATGQMATKASDMVKVVEAYYANLYSAKQSDRASRRGLFRNMTIKVNRESAKELEDPIDGESVVRAILKGKLGRSPSEDGIPHDWYKEIMTLRGSDVEDELDSAVVRVLVVFFQAVQSRRALSEWYTRGVLTTLYKKGDPTEVQNYRPLSIMGSDYRIYT